MPTKVLLPKFGQTVETSEIVSWTAAEGAMVRKGDILCEIATDKSSLEVESQYEGTLLRILLKPGVTAPVGCVMAIVGETGERLDATFLAECLATHGAAPRLSFVFNLSLSRAGGGHRTRRTGGGRGAPVRTPEPIAAAAETGGRVFISPRARRLADARQVPVARLAGSGENGRIVEADVRAYLETIGPVTPTARVAAQRHGIDLRGVAGSGDKGRIRVADLAATRRRPLPPPLVAKLEKPSPMRRAIAQNMLLSAQTIPAFQLEVTVDAAALIARREDAKAAGAKIGYGDLCARAVALAIRAHPVFAATWTDQGIQYRATVDLGFAVAVPGGLVVPVVRGCDGLDVQAISAASAALVAKARAGKLAPEDYTGGVFTLSNLGAFAVDRFVAIVPPGQSGIIAIGRIRDEVVVRDGGLFPAKVLSLTLSADHRYVDGADGAAFMTTLKELLEDAGAL